MDFAISRDRHTLFFKPGCAPSVEAADGVRRRCCADGADPIRRPHDGIRNRHLGSEPTYLP